MQSVLDHWYYWFHNENVVVCMFYKEKKEMLIEKAEISPINTSFCLFHKVFSLD